MDSNEKKTVIRGLGCLSPFKPTFDFSEKSNSVENKTKLNIYQEKSTNTPNYKKYIQQEFYDIVHNNIYEEIATKRIKILLLHIEK